MAPALTTPDVLFLIPMPWLAQVWVAFLVSGLTIVAVMLNVKRAHIPRGQAGPRASVVFRRVRLVRAFAPRRHALEAAKIVGGDRGD